MTVNRRLSDIYSGLDEEVFRDDLEMLQQIELDLKNARKRKGESDPSLPEYTRLVGEISSLRNQRMTLSKALKTAMGLHVTPSKHIPKKELAKIQAKRNGKKKIKDIS